MITWGERCSFNFGPREENWVQPRAIVRFSCWTMFWLNYRRFRKSPTKRFRTKSVKRTINCFFVIFVRKIKCHLKIILIPIVLDNRKIWTFVKFASDPGTRPMLVETDSKVVRIITRRDIGCHNNDRPVTIIITGRVNRISNINRIFKILRININRAITRRMFANRFDRHSQRRVDIATVRIISSNIARIE